jgi:SAM-dependent methyltransferase
MDPLGVSSYGDAFADVYDDWYRDLPLTEQCAGRVAELSAGRRVLELGVGTGRLAHAISALGVHVTGIDASASMLAKLRAKAPADAEPVDAVLADMARPPFAPATFGVVLIAFNTLFNLRDEEEQRRCLVNARAVARNDGLLVVETIVFPDADRPVQGVDTPIIEVDRVVLTASRLDPNARSVDGQHIEITEQGIRLRPWRLHYLLPDELDRLAVETGWQLVSRTEGWDGEAFTPASEHQVSIYRPAR